MVVKTVSNKTESAEKLSFPLESVNTVSFLQDDKIRITKNNRQKCLEADIIVTAVGKYKLLTEDMVKKGTVVIDTGIVFVDHKMHGDVDFENVQKKASYITPTPGGVGPITVSQLLLNTVICAERSK